MTKTPGIISNEGCSAKEILSSSRTFLMGIAMISVVMFHERLLPTFFLTTLFRLFGCWGVDIFLFLSGFGCAYAMRKYMASFFLKTRMLRVLPACFVVGLALSIIDTHFMVWELKWGLLFRLLGLNYWYIQAILMLYLLTPLFYIVIKRWKATGLLGLMILVCLSWLIFRTNIGGFCINYTIVRTTVYLLGLYVGIHDFRVSRWMLLISAVSCAVGMDIRWFHYEMSWQIPQTMSIAFAIPGICYFLSEIKRYCDTVKITKVVEIIGLYSLEIYLIHEFVLHSLYSVSGDNGISAPYYWLIKVIAFIAILIIACKAMKLITSYIVSKFNT